MKIDLEKLKINKEGIEYPFGYRLVLIYDNHYNISTYSPTIKGFMVGFSNHYPIMDEDVIPEFVSGDDLLERYLKEDNIKDIIGVAIYDTNGNLIKDKYRTI